MDSSDWVLTFGAESEALVDAALELVDNDMFFPDDFALEYLGRNVAGRDMGRPLQLLHADSSDVAALDATLSFLDEVDPVDDAGNTDCDHSSTRGRYSTSIHNCWL
jgi:hypothetical protein